MDLRIPFIHKDPHSLILAMKITTSITFVLTALLLLMSACSSSQTKESKSTTDTEIDTSKIIIVYLSRTNNTKVVAEIIQKNLGGKLLAIELQNPYPENYQATVQQVARENETGYLPPLKTRIDSIQKYRTVFVGFPTWGMKLPPPMKSFLKSYDLAGKTIIPFNTHGGYGAGTSFETVKELCPNSEVLEGFSIRGGLERDGEYLVIRDEKRKEAETSVKNWLQKIKLIK
jgi:flavodoxin